MVLAAAGYNGNCSLRTCAVLFLPIANSVVTGSMGVHVGSIPWTCNCLLSSLVLVPVWSSCTHTVPDGLSV